MCWNPRICRILVGWLLLARPLWAGTSVDVDIGWEQRLRQGTWTPLFITVSDPKPHNAVLELTCPHDSSLAMKIHQPIAIGPTAQTYVLYAPVIVSFNEPVTLSIRDRESGKLLREISLLDRNNDDLGNRFPSFYNNSNAILIGVSGRGRALGQQIDSGSSGPQVGFLHPLRLPRVAQGYDALNFLVLNQPDFASLELDQQKAICDWVRAGGSLVLWLGEDPIPTGGPLVDLLPCRIGDVTAVEVPKEDLQRWGLPQRFGKFKARQLIARQGARVVPLLGKSGASAIVQSRGLGQVTVLSFDASGLTFNNSSTAQHFWGMVFDPKNNKENSWNNSWTNSQGSSNQIQSQGRADAARQIIDLLGDVPGVGTFGFGYVAAVLLGMMVIVGPVDWFVLKKMGRQPLTWVTTAGWIGVITTGALFIGSVFRSGDLHLRTLRVIDQVDDAVVAGTDVVGIYSPRTTDYKLVVRPGTWWEPISTDLYTYSRNLIQSVPFNQEGRDNIPDPQGMLINVWNLRFLSGERLGRGEPVITASLARKGQTDVITGTITNLSDAPLAHVWLRTSTSLYELTPQGGLSGGVLPPKASISVTASAIPNTLWSQQQTYGPAGRWGQAIKAITSTPLSLAKAAGQLSTLRSARVDAELEQNPSSRAVLYALSDSAPAAATLAGEKPVEKHWQVIRALVSLKDAP